jgi:hypothetical protein
LGFNQPSRFPTSSGRFDTDHLVVFATLGHANAVGKMRLAQRAARREFDARIKPVRSRIRESRHRGF